MKIGDKFIHAKWLDESHKPLECVVTAIRSGCVYWKAVGASKSKDCFPLEDAAKYVRKKLA